MWGAGFATGIGVGFALGLVVDLLFWYNCKPSYLGSF